MPRKRRPLVREDAVRDARLVIIATEDTKAAFKYFTVLTTTPPYKNPKVHVEVLSRENTASAPEYVLQQIHKWLDTYQINEEDELWLVIDVDRWGDTKLSKIAQECVQKGIHLAVSNPAIELWFLLHLTDLARYDESVQQAMLLNKRVKANRTYLEQAILDIVGRYNKSNLTMSDYLPHVEKAVERAEKLDTNPGDRWPQQLGTRVYLVIRSILASRFLANR